MKYISALLLTVSLWFIYPTLAFSDVQTYIRKTWTTNEPMLGDWVFMWIDQWGGKNSQCQEQIYAHCNTWSWEAKYPVKLKSSPDPCPEINTVEYGENLSRYESFVNGSPIPPEVIFEFNISEIILE